MTLAATERPVEESAAEAVIGPGGRLRTVVLFTSAVATLAGLVLVAISVGSSGVGVADAAWAIGTKVTGTDVDDAGARIQTIVFELRLPRIALAAVAGAALALSGVAMQAVLRNPMVSPFTLGISSAAAFGASLAIMAGASASRGNLRIVTCAVLCATVCGALTMALSWLRQASPEMVILAGLALTYLFTALTSGLQYFASEQQLSQIVRWTFGSVNEATWSHLVVVAVVTAVGLPLLMVNAGGLNAVAFAGDDAARTLGLNVPGLRTLSCSVAVVLAAVVVSYTGVIAFVGLVGPHMARLLIGPNHHRLLPFSALCGAILLVGADTAGRTLFAPVVIPVGIVVSLIGAPLFMALVLLRRRSLR